MANPKVVLIGGTGGAGKTSLGRAIAARLNGATLTIDDLFTAAFAVTTPETNPGLHKMSRSVTGMSAVEYFTNFSLERFIADANAMHEAIWPAAERVIRKRSETEREPPIAIDGWHMRPERIASLDLGNVASFWLVVDRSVLEQRERGESFYGQSSDPDKMLQNFLARSYWYNDMIRQQAKQLNLNIIRQDGTKSVDELCDMAISHF